MINNQFYLSLSMILVVLFYKSVLYADSIEIIKPAKLSFQEKATETKPYEIRKGYIEFESGVIFPELKIKVNDIIKITLFENLKYECLVESVTKNKNSTISIGGKIKGHDFSTVLITIDRDNFIIYLKDLNKNHEYNAFGSILNELGIITEIDLAKTPPRIHLPPLNVN